MNKITAKKIVSPNSAINKTDSQEDFITSLKSLKSSSSYIGLIQKLKMIIEGHAHALMILGDPGVAKSTLTCKILDDSGKKQGQDYTFIKGYATPAALYESLYHNRREGSITIIDDCDAALKNSTALDLLKAALDDKYKRKISYKTRRQNSDLPQEFTYYGRVIFITNHRAKRNDYHFKAVRDRCLSQEIYLDAGSKLEYIKNILIPLDYKNSTIDERKKVFTFLEQAIIDSNVDFTYRTYYQLVDFYRFDQKYFEHHLEELLPADTVYTTLIKIIRQYKDQPHKWETKFIEKTGKSRRTYFNYKKKLLEIHPTINVEIK